MFSSVPEIREKYGIVQEDIAELLVLIEERAEHVTLSGRFNICRDSDDDAVIETALNGSAQYIITREDDVKFDKKVTVFLSKHGISAITVANFLKPSNNLRKMLLGHAGTCAGWHSSGTMKPS